MPNRDPVRVLLVEDNPGDALLMGEMLEIARPEGFRTVCAATLADARTRLREGADCVLLDLSLPDSQGLETLQSILAEAPTVPVVVVTGLDDEQTALHAVERGAQDYLIKGAIDSLRLQRTIRHAIGRHQKERGVVRKIEGRHLDSMGRFAGSVAHDVSNLLTLISGHSQLLLDDVDPGDGLYDHVVEIRAAAAKAHNIMEQLLTAGGLEALEPRECDVNELLGSMRSRLEAALQGDVKLDLRLGAGVGPVHVDPDRLELVVATLVRNARQVSPKGARVEVETSEEELGDEDVREGRCDRPGRFVRIAVRDEGPGMDEETRARVFLPSYRSEPGRQSRLGLGAIYGIVRQSSGCLTVRSSPGRGASFEIHLPPASARARVPAACEFGGLPGGDETILLLDDSDEERTGLAALLRGCGYTVIEAKHAHTALRSCEEHFEPIDLLVARAALPALQGPEFAALAACAQPRMRALYVVDGGDPPRLRRELEEIGGAMLERPFRPEEVAARVREVLEREPAVRN